MEIYTLRMIDATGQCQLSGPLGIVSEAVFESVKDAALHAQFCAQGNDATLRVMRPDGSLRDERPIPPASKRSRDGSGGLGTV